MQAQFRHAVVGLAKVAVNASRRGGENQPAVARFFHVGPGGVGYLERAFDVDLINQIPVVFGHLVEAFVPQDAGIVDDDVDAAEIVHRGLDDLVAIGNGIVVGNGFATGSNDFVHHQISGSFAGAFTKSAATQVVDHDLGTAAGEFQCMALAQSVAGAGDDNHAIIKADVSHEGLLVVLIVGVGG